MTMIVQRACNRAVILVLVLLALVLALVLMSLTALGLFVLLLMLALTVMQVLVLAVSLVMLYSAMMMLSVLLLISEPFMLAGRSPQTAASTLVIQMALMRGPRLLWRQFRCHRTLQRAVLPPRCYRPTEDPRHKSLLAVGHLLSI